MSGLRRVLVANRGEIARRIVRACAALDIESVAVFSEADRDAPFVAEADEAVPIGAAPAAASYLDMAAILGAARASGADAIHPGYGFLSENAAFARRVEEAGLVFVGPPASAIARMGSKVEAKAAAEAAGVPVLPGYRGADQSPERLMREAAALGPPFLVKASAGGGGRGMRLVSHLDEAAEAIAAARAEAQAAFGDGTVFLERFAPCARHVEVQVLGDHHGNLIHLFERDCSLQRNHQKLVEEAPAPDLPAPVRAQMLEAALALARAIGYVSAGTVEFLYDGARGAFAFLEMNTRLQVEHPVTEAVTGVDLVAWQLRIARGERLEIAQDDVVCAGHAVEVRIAAEDAAEGFRPSTGLLAPWRPPTGRGLRLDSGVEEGSTVSHHYDSMLAKLIVHAPDRPSALRRMEEALDAFVAGGPALNLSFQRALVGHETVLAARHHTGSVQEMFPQGWRAPPPTREEKALAVLAVHLVLAARSAHSVWGCLGAWRITQHAGRPGRARYWLRGADGFEDIGVDDLGGERTGAQASGALAVVDAAGPVLVLGQAAYRRGVLSGLRDGVPLHRPMPVVAAAGGGHDVHVTGRPGLPVGVLTLEEVHLAAAGVEAAGAEDVLRAPMPGAVVELRTAVGMQVARGQPVVVVEAMKLLQSLPAPADGTVAEVFVAEGQSVTGGAALLRIDRKDAS